jgi:hypothetical protein
MSAIINRADGRKTVRDASDDLAKTGTKSATAGRKTAHDASEARGETVRKDIAATNHDVTRKNAEAAEQNFQNATEDLRDTMERSAETRAIAYEKSGRWFNIAEPLLRAKERTDAGSSAFRHPRSELIVPLPQEAGPAFNNRKVHMRLPCG